MPTPNPSPDSAVAGLNKSPQLPSFQLLPHSFRHNRGVGGAPSSPDSLRLVSPLDSTLACHRTTLSFQTTYINDKSFIFNSYKKDRRVPAPNPVPLFPRWGVPMKSGKGSVRSGCASESQTSNAQARAPRRGRQASRLQEPEIRKVKLSGAVAMHFGLSCISAFNALSSWQHPFCSPCSPSGSRLPHSSGPTLLAPSHLCTVSPSTSIPAGGPAALPQLPLSMAPPPGLPCGVVPPASNLTRSRVFSSGGAPIPGAWRFLVLRKFLAPRQFATSAGDA